ncbi:hypothetical protein Agub_g11277, partial [Astrephomene gubernaculifera]
MSKTLGGVALVVFLLQVLLHPASADATALSPTCANALSESLNTRLADCGDTTSCIQNVTDASTLGVWLAPVLRTSCVADMFFNSNNTLKWFQYPAWHNGLIFNWLWETAARIPALRGRFSQAVPTRLPPPADIPDAETMHAITDGSNSANFITEDVSGQSLGVFLSSQQEYQSGHTSGLGFNHLPENACADTTQPTGPLHPRTYLMLFYRPDALAALHAAGHTTSASPPEDWDAMLDLLRAHAAAANATRNASAVGANSSLPRYGLCLTTDPGCGRLGDVFAAVAASVLQTAGTQQGYVFDLSVAPPAVVQLVNGTGWRYAATLLQQLLWYNAPEAAVGIATSNSSSSGMTCRGVSQAFVTGECLMTLEWDAALPVMSAAAALKANGSLAVAPLPGSRWVVRRTPSGTADGSPGEAEALTPCTAELCALSGRHDLLYLNQTDFMINTTAPSDGSVVSMATAAAAAAAAAESSNSVLGAFASLEAAELARRGVVPLPRYNRAPYSASYAMTVRTSYAGYGMDGITIAGVAAIQQSVLDQLDSFRSGRQEVCDALRRPLGYTVHLTGDKQNCSGYAAAGWWQALEAAAAVAGAGRGGGGSLELAEAANATAELAAAVGSGDVGMAGGYLRALWHVVHHPNAAPDMQSPVPVNWYKYALSYSALLLLPNTSSSNTASSSNTSTSTAPTTTNQTLHQTDDTSAAIALLTRLFADAATAFGSETLREAYVASISAPAWQPPSSAGGEEDDGGGRGLGSGGLAAIATSPAVAVVGGVVAVVLLVLQRRRRRRHRDLLGRVVAPRVGPDTTLLVTDVQNSTLLWEQLPVHVMDLTLKLHHCAIRRQIAEYDGYESATEGDCFIVAFADPGSAVAFAINTQVELMRLDWPPELLEHPDAAPLVVALADPRVACHAALGLPIQPVPMTPPLSPHGQPSPLRIGTSHHHPHYPLSSVLLSGGSQASVTTNHLFSTVNSGRYLGGSSHCYPSGGVPTILSTCTTATINNMSVEEA